MGNKERKRHVLYDENGNPTKDKPWIFRTYAGHTNVWESNKLYRGNLSRGQTGLSIAFDLPTQCGYSSDHPLARPEIGKVGVPINSLDDFHILFDGIPIEEMNTSMTINATSMWLLALYIALAKERGVEVSKLQGTTQNDIVKEYLARGTYIFPPEPSFRLISEMYEYCIVHLPKWNPSNISSYHLQEAGATPVQELAYSLANAIGLLDLIKERGKVSEEQFEMIVGRISFFVNAGIRFIEEMCKMRAFVELWDEITLKRYNVKNPKYRLFRYGVQVNSLGLTEKQPENNAWRILIEALGVTLSRKARCRALQLPAWNEALSLPRPWDQQWSLRLQQILAYETDLLEYPDIFDGSYVIESKVNELKEEAQKEIQKILDMGGIRVALETGYIKSQLVRSMSERMSKINSGEIIVVGVNKWTDGLPSPLQAGDGGIFKVDPESAKRTLEALEKTKKNRNPKKVREALEYLKECARNGENLMPASIECALARVTTGEWADALREIFGEYRPPTGIEGQRLFLEDAKVTNIRNRVEDFTKQKGHRPRIVVGKPGLDGHSNGAEMIAVAARHCGFDVIYSGIRLTPQEIVHSAIEEHADILGLSIMSGSHLELVEQVMEELKKHHAFSEIPVVVGGIIPQKDFDKLYEMGVKRIFTPSDYHLIEIMEKIMDIIEESQKEKVLI
ncbi:MAG: protein meaA [Leptospiraceae bacterium]|nr:protein meaA [Leptospiraceae bacterium]MDW7976525.1 protein meaA [Leptospiraceae bacterium]